MTKKRTNGHVVKKSVLEQILGGLDSVSDGYKIEISATHKSVNIRFENKPNRDDLEKAVEQIRETGIFRGYGLWFITDRKIFSTL